MSEGSDQKIFHRRSSVMDHNQIDGPALAHATRLQYKNSWNYFLNLIRDVRASANANANVNAKTNYASHTTKQNIIFGFASYFIFYRTARLSKIFHAVPFYREDSFLCSEHVISEKLNIEFLDLYNLHAIKCIFFDHIQLNRLIPCFFLWNSKFISIKYKEDLNQ